MPPRFVENDGTYLWLLESELVSQRLLSERAAVKQRSYFNNLPCGNFGFVISLAYKASSLCQHIVNILTLGSKPDVVRSDAESAIAPVKNAHAIGNGSEVNYPGQPMCPDRMVSEGELTISRIPEQRSVPKPATVGFLALNYSLPKALKNAIVDYHSSICAFGLQARRAFSF